MGLHARAIQKTKKCGAESSDPNRHSQPRLPGSVVGKLSMWQGLAGYKITEVTIPKGTFRAVGPRAVGLRAVLAMCCACLQQISAIAPTARRFAPDPGWHKACRPR